MYVVMETFDGHTFKPVAIRKTPAAAWQRAKELAEIAVQREPDQSAQSVDDSASGIWVEGRAFEANGDDGIIASYSVAEVTDHD